MEQKEEMFHRTEKRFGEQYKDCLLEKMENLFKAFNQEGFVSDQEMNKRLEHFKDKIKKVKSDSVGQENHMAHILGQFIGISGHITRLIKMKKENRADNESARASKKAIEQTKEAINGYINLCEQEEFFFRTEILRKEGFWGKRAINVNGKNIGIAEMSACDFVKMSQEHYERKEKMAA